jgi:hypothetical protein
MKKVLVALLLLPATALAQQLTAQQCGTLRVALAAAAQAGDSHEYADLQADYRTIRVQLLSDMKTATTRDKLAQSVAKFSSTTLTVLGMQTGPAGQAAVGAQKLAQNAIIRLRAGESLTVVLHELSKEGLITSAIQMVPGKWGELKHALEAIEQGHALAADPTKEQRESYVSEVEQETAKIDKAIGNIQGKVTKEQSFRRLVKEAVISTSKKIEEACGK